MVSLEDSQPHSHSISHTPPNCHYSHYTPPPPSSKIGRRLVRSVRTIRSSLSHPGLLTENSPNVSENLTDSVIDIRLGELANKSSTSKISPSFDAGEFLDISRAFSDISACSSDISGELRRLANLPDASANQYLSSEIELETFSSEIIEIISPEDLQPTVRLCIDGLQSSSMAVKRSAAAKLRLLAKNRADNRALIGESGAVPALIPLLRCSDPMTQEHAVTALLNLSLHESNKSLMTNAIAFKSLIYVLKTGTEISKQNSACALLNLASTDENKLSIGACGAIPPLASLLMSGCNRSKKDALTTLYKVCSVRLNKERAVNAGAVRPLVELVAERGSGVAEKAMVVLSSLVGVEIGREAVVDEGGIAALVEVVEDGSEKGKEFAIMSLLLLCGESVGNRGLLVREGAIPPLMALSQSGTLKAKHKAETLLGYLREPRSEASSSSPYRGDIL